MKILVTGSIAYDTIMVFPDRFRNHLLADQLHILNVCFLTPEMRREYGGTAGNIAYNLRLLGEDPIVMATVGEDIDPYFSRFKSLGLSSAHLKRIAGQFTAQGFITTDLDNNQITNFHPGAMNFSHENRISDGMEARLAIIGPDGKLGMVEHARQCAQHRIPFLFDPGQGLPMFSGEELAEFETAMRYMDQPIHAYLAQLAVIQQHDTTSRLSQIAVPTLVLAGEQDILIPVSLSRRLHEQIPGAQWATTRGGHACVWEFPAEFNQTFLEFTKQHGRG